MLRQSYSEANDAASVRMAADFKNAGVAAD